MSVILASVELGGAYLSKSSGVLADALHVFGHILMVSLSLFAVSRGALWKTRAALAKGIFMVSLAVLSLIGAFSGFFSSVVPQPESMGFIGMFAFVSNIVCLGILWKQRNEDLNMKSTWLCAANDLLIDLGIVVASVVVNVTHMGWPDSLIGTLFSILVLRSSVRITKQAYLAMSKESLNPVKAHSKIQAFVKPLPFQNVEEIRFESMRVD